MYVQPSAQAMMLIDCTEPMFVENEHGEAPFKNVIQAAFNFYDNTLDRNYDPGSRMFLMLWHPYKLKRKFAGFQDMAADTYKRLFNLTKKTVAELKEEFCVAEHAPMSEILLQAATSFPKLFDYQNFLYIVTATEDPTYGDQKERINSLIYIKDLANFDVHLDVLPLVRNFSFDPFYKEVYETMQGREIRKYYYDTLALSDKLIETVEFMTRYTRLGLRTFLGSKTKIMVLLYSPTRPGKLSPSVVLCKDTREVLLTGVTYSEGGEDGEEQEKENECEPEPIDETGKRCGYFIQMGNMHRDIPGKTAKLLRNTNAEIPVGITFIEARPFTEKPYSKPGYYCKPCRLIKSIPQHPEMFNNLWESFKECHILSYVKLRDIGRIYSCELTPVMIKNERHFEVKFIPNLLDISEHIMGKVMPAPASGSGNYDDPLHTIIEEMTIKDFNLADLRPTDFDHELNYIKKELLGPTYDGKPVDYVNDRLYSGSAVAIAKALNMLPKQGQGKGDTRKRKKTVIPNDSE